MESHLECNLYFHIENYMQRGMRRAKHFVVKYLYSMYSNFECESHIKIYFVSRFWRDLKKFKIIRKLIEIVNKFPKLQTISTNKIPKNFALP